MGERPFGVYVHVPFCASRCGYCNFVTYTANELGGGELQRAYPDAAIAEGALAGTALTRPELLAVWDDAGIATPAGRGYHLVVELAQRGVLCLGPYRGTEQCFVLVADHVRDARRLGREESLAELAATGALEQAATRVGFGVDAPAETESI